MNTKQLIKSLKDAEALLAPISRSGSSLDADTIHRVNNARQIIAGCILELETEADN